MEEQTTQKHTGSMAFVIVGHQWLSDSWRREILGFRGILVEGAQSAFACELGALDLATEAADQLAVFLPRKGSALRATL